MANAQIKERSYRIVNALRLKNQRENRMLHDRLYSKQGLHSTYVNELHSVCKEQERIRKELSSIRKTMTTTTWGVLPIRDDKHMKESAPKQMDLELILYGQRGKEMRAKKKRQKLRKETKSGDELNPATEITDQPTACKEEMEEKNESKISLPRITTDSTSDSELQESDVVTDNEDSSHTLEATERTTEPTGTETKTDTDDLKLNVETAKENVLKRLAGSQDTSSDVSPRSQSKKTLTKKSSKSNLRSMLTPIEEQGMEEYGGGLNAADGMLGLTNKQKIEKKRRESNIKFDRNKYNPDGSLRTMHKMPEMKDRLKEARKARYIRHPTLQEVERELSIGEILGNSHSSNNQAQQPLRT